MKKLKVWSALSALLIAGSGLFFTSCEEDFELNAPYQEIPIVYGLLNQNETAHLITINKSFLGEDNAFIYAAIADSGEYDNLTAYVEEWVDGSKTRRVVTPRFIITE